MAGVAPDSPLAEKGAEEDVRDMIEEEAGTLFSKHARVLVYINTSALLAGALWLGIYIQKFTQLEQRETEIEQKMARVTNVERLDAQIGALTAEVARLRDRLDRLLDERVAVRARRE